MKIKQILTTSILMVCITASGILAQRPAIMVIPFTKEGEDIRTILEDDVNKRIVITEVQRGFNNRDFQTVDFLARLRAANMRDVLASDNQADIKDAIVSGSGAEIYVSVEIVMDISPNRSRESWVRLIMTAYDIATGASLSNMIGESGRFFTDDVSRLAQRAAVQGIEEFLNTMQASFDNIVQNGRPLVIDIGIAHGSELTMSSRVGSDNQQLSRAIETWIADNAYQGVYTRQGRTANRLSFDDVRIPLRRANGRPFTVGMFEDQLSDLFEELGVTAEISAVRSTISISIR
ncbi:MAG: DUF6175 family protein [Chitinivibrionia bacterium]|nr:DUF6175 family protein [Chitinivibrionia bacterium]